MYDDHRENVFYGTDDGDQDGSFGEFQAFRDHYNSVGPERQKDIHMISVVGGLYGLNLIPLWQPKRITIFDINPAAIAYFKIIHKVFISSENAEHFLCHLTNGDYEAETELDQFVRKNICLRRKEQLPRARGSSKRSYEESWTVALENFDLTKKILTETLLKIRTEPMESESFSESIRQQNNVWIYASNIAQFHFFDLDFEDTSNVVLLQIIHPAKPQLLDLAPLAGSPVKAHVEIPMRAKRMGEKNKLMPS